MVRTERSHRFMSTVPPKLRLEPNMAQIRSAIASVEAAIADIRAGKMVIVVDDADRENEGDLCIAAEKVTPEAVNFMARYGRGLICLSLTEEILDRLNLSMMVPDAENTSGFGTAFTISIEARQGVTTGISAADRAKTIRTAIADDAKPHDLARPGHVCPLRPREGGGLRRLRHTHGPGAPPPASASDTRPASPPSSIAWPPMRPSIGAGPSRARMPDSASFRRARLRATICRTLRATPSPPRSAGRYR